MALTRVAAAGINTGQTFVLQNVNTSGIVTAGTVQVGAATTIHSGGIDLGGGNITSHNINSTGIITATGGFVGAVTGNVTGNLTGNVTGDVTGNLTGDVTGDLTGNVTGNVTGNLTGTATTASSLSGTPDITVGAITASSAIISGDLTVQGTTTTLDTTLTEVDRLEVGANNATVGVAITQSGTGDILRLYDSSTQVVTVTDGGKVGIGTDTITGKVQIDTYSANRGLTLNAPGNGTYITFESNDTAFGDIGSEAGIVGSGTNDLFALNARSTRDLAFRTNSAERLRITSSGNVGIATTNPTETLHVEGNARVTGILTVGQNSTTINGAHEYPSIRPTLDLNFAATKTLDRRITFTRDSLGTYVDELGVLKYASNNTPRFDHNPDTGESLGLLIEESRTNAFLYSDLSTVDTTSNATTSRTTGLDGNSTSALDVTYTSASGAYILSYSSPISASTEYTFSVWIKKVSGSTTGSVYSYVAGGTDGVLSGQIYNTDGQHLGQAPTGVWKRYSKTFTTSAGSTAIRVTMPGYDSNGLNIHYFGAQIEAGAFATSYIPTSGSTVTRAADIAKITGTNFTDFYNDTEGTLFIHADKSETTNDMGVTINNMSSVSDNRIELRLTGGNTSTTRHVINSGGTGYMDSTTNIIDVNRYSFAFARNNAIPCTNGTLGTLDTIIEMPVGVNQMTIGSTPAFSGDSTTRIRQVSYYNKRLPNAQLQGLTAQ